MRLHSADPVDDLFDTVICWGITISFPRLFSL